MLKPAAALIAASFIALPALAQNAPPNMKPTRDVAVTYRMTAAANVPPQEIRMAWAVTDGKQRVDPPGGMGWMLIDRKANSAVMVMEAQRMVMTLPPQAVAAMTQDTPPNAQFTRKATAQVAGQSCTEWDITFQQGTSTICLTNDGVMLRAVTQLPNNGGSTRMEATEVRYGAQDPARFQVPQGYQPMQMPSAPPGAAPGSAPAPAAPAR